MISIFVDRFIPEHDKFILGLKSDITVLDFSPIKIDFKRVGFVWENDMRLMPWGNTQYETSRWFT